MSDITEITEKGQCIWESLKKIFSLLKERKFFAALKESFSFLYLLYKKYLKGQYVTIKGKKIPRTLIACFAVIILYGLTPSNNTNTPKEAEPVQNVAPKKEANVFDENGLKVYELRKCETEDTIGACGILENYSEENFDNVKVSIIFYAPDGTAVYEGGIEATNVDAKNRFKISIPCPEEFAYFKLEKVVLNSAPSEKQ